MRVLRPLVLSLLLVLGGGITALSAQNREVSGKVLDANQQPLVGVAVLVDGTTKGVTTSENGTFKIQVPSGEAVLQVTCLGYLPQKVTVVHVRRGDLKVEIPAYGKPASLEYFKSDRKSVV